MNLIKRSVAFTIKAQQEDDEFFYFEGYGSTFDNVDEVDDVICRGCFVESLSRHGMPSLLWQHDMREPIGVYVEAHEDEKGLFLKGKMPKADTLVNGRVIPQMKVGSVRKMSIGFTMDRDGYEWKDGVRLIKRARLYEVSLVTIPANPQAEITDMSSKAVTPFKDYPLADEDTAWNATAAVGRIREKTGSVDAPSASYKNAFMWFDAADAENFGAYKLPYVDVVDGQLKAVPRAIIAIAGVLSGARGGADIPDADQERIKAHIARYYDKMGMTPPWEQEGKGFIGAGELGGINTKRELERLLRSTGAVSKSAALAIAAMTDLGDERSAVADSIFEELKGICESLRAVK